MEKQFRALRVYEHEDGRFERRIQNLSTFDLPDNEILIEVHYSSLNYKDALSATGNKGVTKQYPHTPGIDAAGVVSLSKSDRFKVGEEVIVTGYDLGMNTDGGFGEYICVPADWVVKRPENLSLKEAMILGTAGYTAAMSVYKLLQNGASKDQGDFLVTGATGGVGTIAVALLSHLGFSVTAATGKPEEKDLLTALGAKELIHRFEVDDQSGRPLLRPKWAGVIDTIGGNTLVTAVKTTAYGGSVTTCGNVASHELHMTVYPFILNGVNLLGIASANSGMAIRQELWKLLSGDWKFNLDLLPITEVTLDELSHEIDLILSSKHKGRTIVKLK